MFEKISDFFTNLMLKLLADVPSVEFDADEAVSGIRDILGYVNYFIPIYQFKIDFFEWLTFMAVATGVIAVYQMVKKKGLH